MRAQARANIGDGRHQRPQDSENEGEAIEANANEKDIAIYRR